MAPLIHEACRAGRKNHVNATMKAQSAYGQHVRATTTPGDTEYDAIAGITRRLQKASDTSGDMPALARALHDNRRLWTILATDVANADNLLPQALRARIVYLSEFTDHHSRKVLAGKASAEALIDINMAVMRGLRQRSVTT